MRAPPGHDLLGARLDERIRAGERMFAAEADRIARLCHRMAGRFVRGGRLIALGAGGADRSDVRHVTVEFVHPVIVGKRALPALGLSAEGGGLVAQIELVAEPDDVAIAFGDGPEVHAAVAVAARRGCLTIGFGPVGAEFAFAAPSDDPFVRQELVETLYHVLWELVHVFFDHRGLLEGRPAGAVSDAGASSFLYPFLDEREDDLEAIVADVRASVLMKAAEVAALRTQTLSEGREALLAAASELRDGFARGGRLLALGNGGSATDAMDVVADFRSPPPGAGWPPRPALDLTEDTAILTAVANDVGVEAMFSRQVIAHGRPGDVVVAITTSGGSANALHALAEARRRGLRTVAFAGYDGGRVAAEGLADHVVVSRSEHIPRIQEAQASALHVLRELVETPGETA
ncbi:MAG: D-sedoheptulose 7-phosphate isomerase [Solirubrobacteraceae bacterium]|nr:D-sedoheptulose 7-phosphate isomerase [Solirubrobacteraceae bacterium]